MNPRNEHVYQTGQAAYDLLVEYLTEEQKNELKAQLDALTYSPADNILFAKQIQQGLWTELFTAEKQAEFPARSLQCLRDGLITTMQYVTSQLFYNVYSHPGNKAKNVKIEKILTPDGKLIKNAMLKIEATMKLISSSFIAYLTQKQQEIAAKPKKKHNPFLSEPITYAESIEEFFAKLDFNTLTGPEEAGKMDWISDTEKNKFYSLLSKLPASEQCFIILDDPYFDGDKFTAETSVTQQINYRISFNVFSRLRVNDKPKIMIPSAGMMQAYLEVSRPTTRMPAVYRFGLSPIEGLYQTMKSGCRDKVICTALLPEINPTIADDYPANMCYGEAELHDFYHETLCADVPRNDRILLTKLHDKLRTIESESTDTNVKFYINKFCNYLIDMEYRVYDRNLQKRAPMKINFGDRSKDPKQFIWETLTTIDVACFMSLGDQESEDDEKQAQDCVNSVKFIADLLAHWLLENNKAFFEQLDFDLMKLMDFRTSHEGLILFMQRTILHQLRDITTAIPRAFESKSLFMVNMVCKDLSRAGFKFNVREGVFARLKAEHPHALAYFIAHFSATPYVDALIKEMLHDKRNPLRKDILDLLYPQHNLNYVYDSDKQTLVQRALYAEDLELLLRLTNDGASVAEVPGASTPCALADAMRTGRYELLVTLIYAYQYGAGWMQRFPEVVARIHRMAKPYDSRLFSHYPEENEDQKWAMQIFATAKIPSQLLRSIDSETLIRDIKQGEATRDRFFKPPTNPREGVVLTEDFFRYMQWAHEGGVIPSSKK